MVKFKQNFSLVGTAFSTQGVLEEKALRETLKNKRLYNNNGQKLEARRQKNDS